MIELQTGRVKVDNPRQMAGVFCLCNEKCVAGREAMRRFLASIESATREGSQDRP